MSNDNPRVSIGLPVYNGEQHLREAIDSILAQTFEDFELIISDNASTDSTQQICEEYAAKDGRIRYCRNEKNIGAALNFNRVFELSRGEYFKWAACDDKCAPELIAKCVEVLDKDSSVVVCHSRTMYIVHDKQGDFQKEKEYGGSTNTHLPQPQQRFYDLVCARASCLQIFGLIRANFLKQTPLIGGYAASDIVLLVKLALFGRFQEIPEFLFYYRLHPKQSVWTLSWNPQAYTFWYAPAREGEIVFPQWRLWREYCLAITSAPISWNQKLRCYFHMGVWLQQNQKILINDLFFVVKQVLRPVKNLLKPSSMKQNQEKQT
ncbi:MAG: glycosyltransferase family 2 protein [Symploca sp. SIO1C4]|uniref:Glycosyltransferase family 2 protein n=1 Tax=Symploca sp. SIO1C4 TaxID=2607765 RepID=A0A6B3NQ88_9CYAN|nr:glycosyltransferase family 2 protein [Symploca sp. SIO1C4]